MAAMSAARSPWSCGLSTRAASMGFSRRRQRCRGRSPRRDARPADRRAQIDRVDHGRRRYPALRRRKRVAMLYYPVVDIAGSTGCRAGPATRLPPSPAWRRHGPGERLSEWPQLGATALGATCSSSRRHASPRRVSARTARYEVPRLPCDGSWRRPWEALVRMASSAASSTSRHRARRQLVGVCSPPVRIA